VAGRRLVLVMSRTSKERTTRPASANTNGSATAQGPGVADVAEFSRRACAGSAASWRHRAGPEGGGGAALGGGAATRWTTDEREERRVSR